MPHDATRPGSPPPGRPATRKPYTRPTVVRYGDMTSLTRSGTGAKNDKGSGSKTRTQ